MKTLRRTRLGSVISSCFALFLKTEFIMVRGLPFKMSKVALSKVPESTLIAAFGP